jgi:hypothetical protein
VRVAFATGGETVALKQLSGGQKTLVALALILAIQVPGLLAGGDGGCGGGWLVVMAGWLAGWWWHLWRWMCCLWGCAALAPQVCVSVCG